MMPTNQLYSEISNTSNNRYTATPFFSFCIPSVHHSEKEGRDSCHRVECPSCQWLAFFFMYKYDMTRTTESRPAFFFSALGLDK